MSYLAKFRDLRYNSSKGIIVLITVEEVSPSSTAQQQTDLVDNDENSDSTVCREPRPSQKLCQPTPDDGNLHASGLELEREPSDISTSSSDTALDHSGFPDRTPLQSLSYEEESASPDSTDSSFTSEQDADFECEEDNEENDDPVEFDPYSFIKHLPPRETVIASTSPVLPPKAKGCKKMTLVLDLDETL
eukprot:scaffold71670_cov36-Prasinocladus_malaysianus.AAC.1